MELPRQICAWVQTLRRIVMRLIEIQPKLSPRAHPIQASGAQRYGHTGEFADSLRGLRGEGAKIRETHFRGGCALEFADRPLRFVGDFPGKKSGVLLKFAKQWNQDAVKKRLAPSGELHCLLISMGQLHARAIQ